MKNITRNSSSHTPVFNSKGVHGAHKLGTNMSTKDSYAKQKSEKKHAWVTVIDPRHRRSLLQACDDCGVVKSENSIIRNCTAQHGQAVLSSALNTSTQIAI